MSMTPDIVGKLQQDLEDELNLTNQLLISISEEVKKIIYFTNAGGEFETTIKQNASLMATIADKLKLDISNLPPVPRS